MRLALVDPGLDPAGPDGDVAELSAGVAVAAGATVFVRSQFAGESRLGDVEIVRVPAPTGDQGWASAEHEWSGLAWAALRRHYADAPPDAVEFPDRGGAAFVALQAAQAADPWLHATELRVRPSCSQRLADVHDGALRDDLAGRLLYDLEAFSLRHADRLLWQSEELRGRYAAAYPQLAAGEVAPAEPWDPQVPRAPRRPAARRRILYAGELSRRGGAADLVEALVLLNRDDWELTLAGPDTATGPLGARVARQVAVTGHPRVHVEEADAVRRAWLAAQHDLVVIPARWPGVPAARFHAARAATPLLEGPVGPRALARALEAWLDGGTVTAPPARPQPVVTAPAPPRRLAPASPLPPVSVVIPSFELEGELARAVASVDAQTHPEVDLVVVDDGSRSPGVLRLLERLAERPRTTVVRQANRGTAAARNHGLALARGELVVLLDADDRLLPRYAERVAQIPGARFVFPWIRCVNPGGGPASAHPVLLRGIGNWTPQLPERNHVPVPIVALHRSLVEAGHGYPERLAIVDDWGLWERLRRARVESVVVPEVLAEYTVRAASTLRTVGQPLWRHVEADLRSELAVP